MPGFLAFVVLALAVGALSYIAWISLQSLLQARLLWRVRQLAELGPGPDGRIAVRGRVQVTRPVRLHGAGDVLWYRIRHQVYRRSGKSGRWVTEHEESEMARFSVRADDRDVEIEDWPTEFQATRTETRYEEPEGCLGRRSRRMLLEWLPSEPRLTAVGRLLEKDGRLRLHRDNKVGLLLSPRDPEAAGWVEVAKGVGGLVAVTALTAAGIWLYYARR